MKFGSVTAKFHVLILDELVVVYPGTRSYELGGRVKVVPITEIASI